MSRQRHRQLIISRLNKGRCAPGDAGRLHNVAVPESVARRIEKLLTASPIQSFGAEDVGREDWRYRTRNWRQFVALFTG